MEGCAAFKRRQLVPITEVFRYGAAMIQDPNAWRSDHSPMDLSVRFEWYLSVLICVISLVLRDGKVPGKIGQDSRKLQIAQCDHQQGTANYPGTRYRIMRAAVACSHYWTRFSVNGGNGAIGRRQDKSLAGSILAIAVSLPPTAQSVLRVEMGR